MGGYLVYRPNTNDKYKISYDINGIFVNAASAAAALTAARDRLARVASPIDVLSIAQWSAVALSGVNQIYSIDIHDVANNNITITIAGRTTTAIPIRSTYDVVQAAINVAIAPVPGAIVRVGTPFEIGVGGSELDYLWRLNFEGTYANTVVATSIGTGSLAGGDTASGSVTTPAHAVVDFPVAMQYMILQGEVISNNSRLRGSGPVNA